MFRFGGNWGARGFVSSLAGLMIAGCGGDVHFNAPAVSTPAGITSVEPRRTLPHLFEKYRAGRPSGSVVVPFVFYASEAMGSNPGGASILDNVANTIDTFLAEFWKEEAGYLTDVRFAVAIDKVDPASEWFSPATSGFARRDWQNESRTFFHQKLQWAKREQKRRPIALDPFYESFRSILGNAKSDLASSMGPTWTRFVYFRDRRLTRDPAFDASLQASRTILDAELQSMPLAVARRGFSSFSYLNEFSPCTPGFWDRGDWLVTEFARVAGSGQTSHEICPDRPLDFRNSFIDVARRIVDDTKRMVLSKVPRAETVVVRVFRDKAVVPATRIAFASPQEFTLTPGAVAPGDEIEVEYEPSE